MRVGAVAEEDAIARSAAAAVGIVVRTAKQLLHYVIKRAFASIHLKELGSRVQAYTVYCVFFRTAVANSSS